MKRVLLAINKLQHFSAIRPFPVIICVTTLVITSLFGGALRAQTGIAEPAPEYRKVIHDRVVKIVNVLGISDNAKYDKTVETVSSQYFALNSIHEKSKENIARIKQDVAAENQQGEIKKEDETKSAQLKQQHDKFIAQLKKDLTNEQVDKIKDGMTYGVLNVTYTAYQDMIPTLTAEQKDKIYAWLLEARELAMDAESSDKKHAVFGKYKGRINNYLSQAGYDMKKEEKAWQARIKERQQSKS